MRVAVAKAPWAVSATRPATAFSAAICWRATAVPIAWFWDVASIWLAVAARVLMPPF